MYVPKATDMALSVTLVRSTVINVNSLEEHFCICLSMCVSVRLCEKLNFFPFATMAGGFQEPPDTFLKSIFTHWPFAV